MPEANSFRKFFELGYRRLVPIVPCNAKPAPGTTLAKRPKSRGKAVGVKGRDGFWYGFDWVRHEMVEEDLDRWHEMGAGVGIKTGEGLVGLDVDTLSPRFASMVELLALETLGPAPRRVGRAPKVLLPYRVSDPVSYTRLEFEGQGGLTERVELLCEGRQFVAWGTHPDTGRPYAWPDGIPPYAELPLVSAASIGLLFERLAEALPGAVRPALVAGVVDRSLIDQESLQGSLDEVQRAVRALPNHFPDRETYIRVACAIKAALPAEPEEAFDLFAEWCERWTCNKNDLATVAADWQGLKPPFGVGLGTLRGLVSRNTDPKAYFEPIDGEIAVPEPVEAPSVAIKWEDLDAWDGMPKPERRWIVRNMVPDGEVTLLTGSGGVGKTLLAQQLATCVAAGIPFFGHEVVQTKVMMFAGEDSADELHIRQKEICAGLALSLREVAPRLRVTSRKFADNLFALWNRNTGALVKQAIWKALLEDARSWGARVVIVDTIADTFGGSEIDRQQVRQFVQAVLGRLAQEIDGAVIALGHPSRVGEATGEGTSGSTAWHASVRSRLYLKHPERVSRDGRRSPVTGTDVRILENMKANYAASGDALTLRWRKGCFDLVSARVRNGDDGMVELPSTDDACEAAVVAAVAEVAARGVGLSLTKTAKTFAPRVLKQLMPKQFEAFTIDEIEDTMSRLIMAEKLVEAVVGRRENRHPINGFRTNRPESIFD